MSLIFRRATVLLAVLLPSLAPPTLLADEPNESSNLTPAQSEYFALADSFDQKLEAYWQTASDITDPKKAEKFSMEQDPGVEFLPKFLAFEQTHRGDDVGLLALAQVATRAASNVAPDSYLVQFRRDTLARMQPYEDRPLAALFVAQLTSGSFDPQVLDYLHQLATSPTADPTLRAIAQLKFADQVLNSRATNKILQIRLEDIAAGMPNDFPEQQEHIRNYLKSMRRVADLDARAPEAIAMLEELAASGEKLRVPAFRLADSINHLACIDTDKSKTNTPLSEKAAGLLYREQHLRLGQPAPELDLMTIDGDTWSLVEHRNQVVVIQFSFTGCGPCEAMYPDLRKMAAELGDRVALVTILRDETPDQAEQAKESGKIAWPIHCDGTLGKLCTKWAVDGFPEIYVIDTHGQIAAIGLRQKQLRWKVEKLLTPSAAKP